LLHHRQAQPRPAHPVLHALPPAPCALAPPPTVHAPRLAGQTSNDPSSVCRGSLRYRAMTAYREAGAGVALESQRI
jgi:hypothetical protein